MRTGNSVTLALACCLAAAPLLLAQAPANAPTPQQQSRPSDAQKPPAKAPQPSESNPFPEDTNAVPVLPNATSPAEAPAWDGTNPGSTSLPGEENDPVRSPDDPTADSSNSSSSSSSLTGLDRVIAPPPDNEKRGKNAKQAPEHQETAAEDENVGSYYLSTKNWRAALSRYQSALVLDPENPEVYWGLAESQRHLGDFAKAKANYLKLLDYDPDSKHAKEAKKALEDPKIENAKAAPEGQGAVKMQ